MRMNQRDKEAVFYPFVIVLLLTVIFSVADNYNYKSEWLASGAVIFLLVVFAFLYGLAVCILALTIYLNRFESVRSNNLLVVLTWFLLPFGFIGMASRHITAEVKYDPARLGNGFIYLLILNVPFIVGLIFSYVRHRNTAYCKQNVSKAAT